MAYSALLQALVKVLYELSSQGTWMAVVTLCLDLGTISIRRRDAQRKTVFWWGWGPCWNGSFKAHQELFWRHTRNTLDITFLKDAFEVILSTYIGILPIRHMPASSQYTLVEGWSPTIKHLQIIACSSVDPVTSCMKFSHELAFVIHRTSSLKLLLSTCLWRVAQPSISTLILAFLFSKHSLWRL